MKSGFRRAVFTLVVIVILSAIHLFIYTQNMDLKYKTTDIKIKLSEIRSKNRLLGSKVARKENLAYVEKFAREKLGMIYPKNINYILPHQDKLDKAPKATNP